MNLHFTGDFHAITAAHNLLAALLDTHLHFGNDLRINPQEILWPRCMDLNDRALRRIATGLGGRANGPARETGFVITAASEIMAILALSEGRADLRQRLARIVVGFNYDGAPVTANDLKAVGPMMVLLNDAELPNLVQTNEGAPAIVHCGPFANIAHGTSSVLAQRSGLHLADYVVNETGFAADLGAEKFFDLVMPMCGHVPAAAAVIVTLKALRTQGGAPDGPLEPGFPNLARHLDNLKRWGVPAVIALNRFPGDTASDLEQVMSYCRSLGADVALAEGYTKGGAGGKDATGEARGAWLRPTARVHRQDAVLVHRRPQADGRPVGVDAERRRGHVVGRCRFRRRHCRQHDADAGTGHSTASPEAGRRRPGGRDRHGLLMHLV